MSRRPALEPGISADVGHPDRPAPPPPPLARTTRAPGVAGLADRPQVLGPSDEAGPAARPMCRRGPLPSVRFMTNTKNAVITGASRGLGLALARAVAAARRSLVIDARDGEALGAAAAGLPG